MVRIGDLGYELKVALLFSKKWASSFLLKEFLPLDFVILMRETFKPWLLCVSKVVDGISRFFRLMGCPKVAVLKVTSFFSISYTELPLR